MYVRDFLVPEFMRRDAPYLTIQGASIFHARTRVTGSAHAKVAQTQGHLYRKMGHGKRVCSRPFFFLSRRLVAMDGAYRPPFVACDVCADQRERRAGPKVAAKRAHPGPARLCSTVDHDLRDSRGIAPPHHTTPLTAPTERARSPRRGVEINEALCNNVREGGYTTADERGLGVSIKPKG